MSETDCTVRGLNFIAKSLTQEEMLRSPMEEAIEEARVMLKELLPRFQEAAKSGLSADMAMNDISLEENKGKDSATEEGPPERIISSYPYLIAMLGSEFRFIKVLEQTMYMYISRTNNLKFIYLDSKYTCQFRVVALVLLCNAVREYSDMYVNELML